MSGSAVTRRAWLAAAIGAAVLAVWIAVSGGLALVVGGVRVSARSWRVAACGSLVAALVWAGRALRTGAVAEDAASVDAWLHHRVRGMTAGIGMLATVTAAVFATGSPSGADASGYLSQAAMWARGALGVADPLASLAAWPLAPGDTAPLGWRPAFERGWQVPTYAPGLPLLMAVPHAVAGIAGATMVVALAAALAVWATAAVALRVSGPVAALLASTLLAASPTFLYQSFQPMSDVPVTAAWAVCWWRVVSGAPLGAGAAAGVAVLVRPNLAPLALIPLVVVVAQSQRRRADGVRFMVPVAAAGATVALLQTLWYGSPFTSGYGTASELFSFANVRPNARLYATWLWQAEPALVGAAALAVAAVWVARAGPSRAAAPGRACIPGLLAFAAFTVCAYLVYAVFDVWSYVRFLLPALMAAAVLGGAGAERIAGRLPAALRGIATVALLVAVTGASVFTARGLGVFHAAAVAARARVVGDTLAVRLPPNAVVLAGEQSGSMRYLTGRPVIRWDGLDAPRLGAALDALATHGFEAWWVLDQWEESHVRQRFAGVPAAALDWPPAVEGGPIMRTRAWRVADRPVE